MTDAATKTISAKTKAANDNNARLRALPPQTITLGVVSGIARLTSEGNPYLMVRGTQVDVDGVAKPRTTMFFGPAYDFLRSALTASCADGLDHLPQADEIDGDILIESELLSVVEVRVQFNGPTMKVVAVNVEGNWCVVPDERQLDKAA